MKISQKFAKVYIYYIVYIHKTPFPPVPAMKWHECVMSGHHITCIGFEEIKLCNSFLLSSENS